MEATEPLAEQGSEVGMAGPAVSDLLGIAGDWHGNDRWAISCLDFFAEAGITKVLHAGDFGIWPGPDGRIYLERIRACLERNQQTLWVVPGNHEDYSQIVDPEDPAGGTDRQVLGGGEEDGWELALLPRGYSWEESGKRFVALGGAPSIDFEMRREGRDWWKEEMIRDSDLERLHRSAGADVMICHDAPDGGTRAVQRIIDTPWGQSMWSPVGLNYAALGRALMNQAVEIVKPKMFFHGHYHVADERYDEDTDQTWVSLGADGEVHNVVVLDLGRMRVGWLSTH
jgi:hypothetical protein